MQVQIGKQGAVDPSDVVRVSSYEDLKAEDLVVVNLQDSAEWEEPFIGSVLDINDTRTTVTIQWMKGSYNKPWKKWVDGVGRNMKPRIDQIPIQSILLFGFQLTRKGNLKKKTITEIKELYMDL